jgi:hypothetical protein
MTNSIQFGAFRSFSYPEDNFDDLNKAPVTASAATWREVVRMSEAGNPLAKKVHGLGRAMNARKLALANGEAVPMWAQDILAPIEDDEDNLDDAIASLSAALR